jgi:hypothetical protein
VEIEAIKKSFAILSEDYNPGFIEILVTKRISHRMFSPVSINNGAKMHFDNPPSGTLITEKITNEYFEFYLVP